MQSPSYRRDGTKSPTSEICVKYKSTERNVRICIQRDANVSAFKTFNTVSTWNGVKGQENDKRLHTTFIAESNILTVLRIIFITH